MDPSAVSLQQGAQTGAHATFTTKTADVLETPATSDMHITNVVGPTQGLTVMSAQCGNKSKIRGGIQGVTMEAQGQAPLARTESEDHIGPLPTPINVQRLQDTLANHPDREFVFKLCNNLRFGADVGFTGRRTARFSKNRFPNLVLFQKISPSRWPLGELQVLSLALHCLIFKCPLSAWFPRSTLLNLGPSFTCLSHNLERQVSTAQFQKKILA